MTADAAPAAERWGQDLESWAIPEPILRAAPESPWSFPVELFERRADAAGAATPAELTPSNLRALDALREGGVALDVGCGAGAASLPLAGRASRLVGVDSSPRMLEAFADRARAAGVAFEVIEGGWPDVAAETPTADVVVCHHVFYNAPDLRTFALRLTDHARVRVVAELTDRHPMTSMNELWVRFHGLERPTRPTADDAEAVLREAGLQPERIDWESDRVAGFERRADLVVWVRRRLCLPADRDPDIAAAIQGRVVERSAGGFGFPPRSLVTLWWPGSAG